MSESKTHVIDGVTYVEVDRKAEVGEKILITAKNYVSTIGKVFTVSGFDDDGDIKYVETDEHYAGPGTYVVLEPLECEECCVDESQASTAVIDMLANLARRVSSLEQQLRATQRNIETFAEQTESNSEDIRTLDERTQSLLPTEPEVEPPTITECHISFSHDGITNLNVSFVGNPSVDELVKVFTKALGGGERR